MAASTPGSDAASFRQGSTTVTSGISVDGRPGADGAPGINDDESVTSALVVALRG
jgi:hypothetical protein